MTRQWYRVFWELLRAPTDDYLWELIAWTIVPCHEKYKCPKAANENKKVRIVDNSPPD